MSRDSAELSNFRAPLRLNFRPPDLYKEQNMFEKSSKTDRSLQCHDQQISSKIQSSGNEKDTTKSKFRSLTSLSLPEHDQIVDLKDRPKGCKFTQSFHGMYCHPESWASSKNSKNAREKLVKYRARKSREQKEREMFMERLKKISKRRKLKEMRDKKTLDEIMDFELKRQLDFERLQSQAASDIQRVYRGHRSRGQYQILRRTSISAAVCIQSVFRGHRERQIIFEKRQAMLVYKIKNDNAALKIQSVVRGRIARRRVLHLRKQRDTDLLEEKTKLETAENAMRSVMQRRSIMLANKSVVDNTGENVPQDDMNSKSKTVDNVPSDPLEKVPLEISRDTSKRRKLPSVGSSGKSRNRSGKKRVTSSGKSETNLVSGTKGKRISSRRYSAGRVSGSSLDMDKALH
eukprot:291439_1